MQMGASSLAGNEKQIFRQTLGNDRKERIVYHECDELRKMINVLCDCRSTQTFAKLSPQKIAHFAKCL